MLRQEPKQLSLHSLLYNKISENHILKSIKNVVDFSFINTLMKDAYCVHFGRPAKEPALMCKLLFLQSIYNLSDEELINRGNTDLAFLYFLDLNPEDSLPDKSLLSKFRTQRLREYTLDEIISHIVKQCMEHGIIKGEGISIDATHIEANTKKKTPERLMKHLGLKLAHSYEEEVGVKLEDIPEVPVYKEIEDHREAKSVMKTYVETVIDKIQGSNEDAPKTMQLIDKAKKILDDPKFINQKGVRSLIDEDARVGRKSKQSDFYGYKTELVMTVDERIITSVKTENGAYVDGTNTKQMIEESIKSGLQVKEVYADKAYFRKDILDEIKELGAYPYIPVSATVYRIDENEFTYNKDSDEWQCKYGNLTTHKKYIKRTTKDRIREGYNYYFDKEQCKHCPHREVCAGKTTRRKILTIGLNTNEFFEISQYQKTDEFIEKYKNRATIEGKNAELKRFHGLSRAKGYSLLSVSKQSKLAAIAVNLKRIAAIVSSSFTDFHIYFSKIRNFFHFIKHSWVS